MSAPALEANKPKAKPEVNKYVSIGRKRILASAS
jgi:hypothetical protein